jgi:predicted ATPase
MSKKRTLFQENPVIPIGVRWEGNLTPEYDYRSIYATVIDQWLTPNDSKSETTLGRKFDQFKLHRSDNDAER